MHLKSIHSPGVSGKSGSEVRGRVELQNFTEDLDDLEIFENTPSYTQEAFIRKTSITKGYFRTLICSRLEEYVIALKAEYGDKSNNSELTKVKSKTVINNVVSNQSKKTPVTVQSSQIVAKRKKKRTVKSTSSNDMIFYLSLLSILGVGVVVAVKLVNRL